jgi:hypothetical protein
MGHIADMEHFSVVQSIIRAGLAGDREAVDKQVQRLLERLMKAGADKEAATLERLRAAARDAHELVPSRVEISRAQVTGEKLEASVNPPIDRETGGRLCEIEFPRKDAVPPVYSSGLLGAVEGLLTEWRNEQVLTALGVSPTRSLLIYGPPGSGKTVTAHYLSSRLGLPLVTARIDGLISSFLGTTARNIANLFEFANRYACVLLLDEFDALAKLRDDPQEIGEIKRVVNTLLQNLDLRRDVGLTIAITNHERLLDPAVWRRFETHLQLGEPDGIARERLIGRFLDPLEVPKSSLAVFSYCLAGKSGADIERICTAVKRTVALSGAPRDAAGLFHALSAVLARTPNVDHLPARILAEDQEAFVSLIANDGNVSLKQIEIGEATGFGQSKVSELKKARKHLHLVDNPHA